MTEVTKEQIKLLEEKESKAWKAFWDAKLLAANYGGDECVIEALSIEHDKCLEALIEAEERFYRFYD